MEVGHACLVDAAIASECFDGDAAENVAWMAYQPWVHWDNLSLPDYPRELWAADWHKLFAAGAARSTLTWKNEFTSVQQKAHNFYSSTEDVMEPFQGAPGYAVIENLLHVDFGRKAWVVQERAKGNIATLFGIALTGTDYGGWGFNTNDPIDHLPPDPKWYRVEGGKRVPVLPSELPTHTPDSVTRSPLFSTGWGNYIAVFPDITHVDEAAIHPGCPDWIVSLYTDATGSAIAADAVKRGQLLSQAIPALPTPVGQKNLESLEHDRNYPMPEMFAPNGSPWPADRAVSSSVQLQNGFTMTSATFPASMCMAFLTRSKPSANPIHENYISIHTSSGSLFSNCSCC